MTDNSREQESISPRNVVQVLPLLEDDLEEFCTIIYDTFPDSLFADVEKQPRLLRTDRIKRLAKHFLPLIRTRSYHLLKAVQTQPGDLQTIVGVAAWMESNPEINEHFPTKYAQLPNLSFPSHFVPCPFRDDLAESLNWSEKMSWSLSDFDEMYAHHSPSWNEKFSKCDKGRAGEMQETPHLYLAPLCVKHQFQGMGIGKALLRWGMDRADDASPPMPCVLESLKTARPVYLKLGFVDTDGHGDFKETQMVRPPSTRNTKGT